MSEGIFVLGAMAVFVERLVEAFVANWWVVGDSEVSKKLRVAITVTATLVAGIVIAQILDLQLMLDIFPTLDLEPWQNRVATGIVIGGGAAPAHELIRYVEEKKQKAAKEKAAIT